MLEVGAGVPPAAPARLLPADRRRRGGAARARAERAHEFTDRPVFVAGFGVATDHPYLHEKDASPRSRPRARAPQRAYAMAGVGPADIDCAEVHDCFTITEILDIEDLGFFEKGKGGVASPRGRDRRSTGRIPVNTSGGLLAKGHPIGATGVAQITECWWQLRGEAGERQVEIAQRLRAPAQRRRPRLGRVASSTSSRTDERVTETTCASRRDADGVGRIVLDRPEAKNALTVEMRDGIVDAVRDVPRRPRRCARCSITGDRRRVLRGHGPRARRPSRRPGKPGFDAAHRRPRRCASACRRSSASSGSSTSRRSPR